MRAIVSYLVPQPVQLDIIADTSLGEIKIRTDLSTSKKKKTRTDLSTDMKRLARRRKELGIPISKLLATAGINRDTYFLALKGQSTTREATIAKLQLALDRLSAGHADDGPETLCLALLRLMIAEFSRRAGWDPALMLANGFGEERPHDPVWLQASRVRRCAVYVMVEGLHRGKAEIAKAIGHSRQAVHKTVAAIEQERERDAAFDALMQTMMDTVKP